MNDIFDTVSALCVDLYECDVLPSAIIDRERPTNYIHYAWIPQTMVDQIWVLYDFRTVADREAWEASLSPKLRGWLNRELIKLAIPYGWHNRDENGFIR